MRFYSLQGRYDTAKIFEPIPKQKTRAWRRIRGFDTETKEGNIFLIQSDSEAKEVSTTEECLKFLVQNRACDNLNFFYNLDYDFRAIMKPYFITLTRKEFVKAYESEKGIWKVGKFIVKYLKGKKFIIKYRDENRKARKAIFEDIGNFFEGGLEKNAKLLLGSGKIPIDVRHFEDYSMEEIKAYGIKDARDTKGLAEILTKQIEKIGKSTGRFTSKASLAADFVRQNVEEKYLKPFIGKQNDLTVRQLIEYAFRAYKGAVFDLRTIGLTEDSIEYDVVSQYPHKIADLPDMVNGYWSHVSEFNPLASLGIYHVRRQFDEFSPYRTSTGLVVYPRTVTLYEDYITKPEIIWLRERGFEVEIIDGYEFTHTKEVEYPFRNLVQKLFSEKSSIDKNAEPSRYLLVKIIMNSIYGKYAESKIEIGLLFNPIYSSYITALSRIQIEQISRGFERIDEIATDAIIGKPKADFVSWHDNVRKKESLGSIGEKEKQHKRRVNYQTGVTFDPDTKDFFRLRGLEYKKGMKISEGKEPNTIEIKYEKPLTLGTAKMQDRIVDLNHFEDFSKILKVPNKKRLWLGRGITISSLQAKSFESEPLGEEFVDEEERIIEEKNKRLWVRGNKKTKNREYWYARSLRAGGKFSLFSKTHKAVRIINEPIAKLVSEISDNQVTTAQASRLGLDRPLGFDSNFIFEVCKN